METDWGGSHPENVGSPCREVTLHCSCCHVGTVVLCLPYYSRATASDVDHCFCRNCLTSLYCVGAWISQGLLTLGTSFRELKAHSTYASFYHGQPDPAPLAAPLSMMLHPKIEQTHMLV
jgi:hypothetical protein